MGMGMVQIFLELNGAAGDGDVHTQSREQESISSRLVMSISDQDFFPDR